MMLQDKVVIIAGVGPGMGRAMALGIARHGGRVAMASRSPDFLAEVASAVTAAGGQSIHASVDVTDPNDCARFVDLTVQSFGRVDGIVNSAYFFPKPQPFETADLSDYARAFDVACMGALRMTRAALPAMKAQGQGSIVNVSTHATRTVMPGVGAYAVAKSALGQATRYLAVELGQYGIRVNQAVMGAMMGEPLRAAIAQQPDLGGSMLSRIPLGRFPNDSDCANAIYFLLSDLSSEITGASLDVNGGEWPAL